MKGPTYGQAEKLAPIPISVTLQLTDGRYESLACNRYGAPAALLVRMHERTGRVVCAYLKRISGTTYYSRLGNRLVRWSDEYHGPKEEWTVLAWRRRANAKLRSEVQWYEQFPR